MFVIVVMAIDMCVGRHVWMKSRLLEVKKLLLHLREELAPEMHGESRGAAAEDANDMIFEHLNGFLGHVASVVSRGKKLVGHAQVADGCFVDLNCLIVQSLGTMPTFCMCSRA